MGILKDAILAAIQQEHPDMLIGWETKNPT